MTSANSHEETLFSEQNFMSPENSDSSAYEYFYPGAHTPLAVRMRPRSMEELLGQDHIMQQGSPLVRLIHGEGESSVILYGPPGVGKTTIASLISTAAGRKFHTLSALDSGVKDIREAIAQAKRNIIRGYSTVLFIDEIHRFSKNQQDALLNAVENRTLLLIAATTENPHFSIVSPLLSRSLVLELRPLKPKHIRTLISRALEDSRGLNNAYTLTDSAMDQLISLAGGDARRALTYLEVAAEVSSDRKKVDSGTPQTITPKIIEQATNKALVRYDRDGDQHYDTASALIKSIRGSDVDAALHYLARMIEGGEDPRFITRRLMILASEDIGMADPQALGVAVATHTAVSTLGLPEARLPLAQAVIYLATTPKSNAVIQAIDSAIADIRRGSVPPVPPHLRDGHYSGAQELGNAVGYQYPHNDPRGVLRQQYIPEGMEEKEYYVPSDHGFEKKIAPQVATLRSIVRGGIGEKRR